MNIFDVIRMAEEAKLTIRGHYDESGSTPAELMRFAELIAAAEREECGKVCELLEAHLEEFGALNRAASAIRSRGIK